MTTLFIGIMCRNEVIQASGTTYIWPATPSDSTASFTCPNNRGFSVFRNCSTLGIWLPFDEGACGVVNQLLTRLNNSFTNVSILGVQRDKVFNHYGTIESIVKHRDLWRSCFNTCSSYWAVWKQHNWANQWSFEHHCRIFNRIGNICGWLQCGCKQHCEGLIRIIALPFHDKIITIITSS